MPSTILRIGFQAERRITPGFARIIPEILSFLKRELGAGAESRIADVGSGTGLSTQLLLKLQCEVFAVEPNAEMRKEAAHALSSFSGFRSIAGSAESSGLEDSSVDLVTAAQAFHWFDPASARREFLRILRPNGWAAMIWNNRQDAVSQIIRT